MARLMKVVDEVIRVERQARRYSMAKGQPFLNDMVARSLSLLQYAHVLQAEEAQNALTAVRLGVELGMVRRLKLDVVEALYLSCGHYALRHSLVSDGCSPEDADNPDFRDQCRASMVREYVAGATLHPLPEQF